MKTFENYPGGKAAAIAAAEDHVGMDQLIRGTYWNPDEHRGCSIGCDVQTGRSPHRAWAELFGTPVWFGVLVDRLFETLPDGEHVRWHVEVRQAMPEGVDITPIGYEHAARCLDRCIGYIGEGDEPWRAECRDVVRHAAAILRTGRWLTEDEAARAAEAAEAARAAWAAWAAWAAESAGASWAARAAWAAWAAWAAEAARAAWAAWAAESAGASWAARAAEIRAQRDDLLELLRGMEGLQ